MLHKLIISIISSRKAGLLRLRRASSPIRLRCIGGECGLCCSVMGATSVTFEESKDLPQGAVISQNGQLQLKCAGKECTLLKDGFCSVYEYRPRGCREYPWYNINGELYYDSGCPGIRQDRDEHPDPKNLRPTIEYLDPLPGLLKRTLLLLFRWW